MSIMHRRVHNFFIRDRLNFVGSIEGGGQTYFYKGQIAPKVCEKKDKPGGKYDLYLNLPSMPPMREFFHYGQKHTI